MKFSLEIRTLNSAIWTTENNTEMMILFNKYGKVAKKEKSLASSSIYFPQGSYKFESREETELFR